MNCEWIKENVVLYIYDELADDARYEFEQHTRRCLACKQEVESALAFKENMAALPVEEVPPNLLASSRMKLQEALETAEQSRGFHRFFFDFAGWMQQIRMAPALTVALLMIGFAGGALATYRLNLHTPVPTLGNAPVAEASIAGIESIEPGADANHILIKYDTLHSQTMEGSTNDPKIQQLLMMATYNNRNSDVRLDSVDILSRQAQDNSVREALVYSLRYDKNPGVRLKALDALKGYVRDDVHVRDAVLEALMHDTNAGVRSEAIGLLDQVRADMSVREALQVLAQHDKDKFIRTESKRYLENTPDLE
jgi:hypothetical protein